MVREDLVRIYNLLSWYFCDGKYPKITAKKEDSCETLIQELKELKQKAEKEKKEKDSKKIVLKNNSNN